MWYKIKLSCALDVSQQHFVFGDFVLHQECDGMSWECWYLRFNQKESLVLLNRANMSKFFLDIM